MREVAAGLNRACRDQHQTAKTGSRLGPRAGEERDLSDLSNCSYGLPDDRLKEPHAPYICKDDVF
jgi:hypothetical protein